ncbi:uncharacterized protein LOC142223765 [Haematobia irritans]|uniref:uncharacterized protein LOC142223765 n=1 Tax=Haematobia irritans TaxID=7368 RepID=UPI003F4F48F9
MLTEVEIKEEPLDENEIQQEMFNKREGEVSLPKQQQHLQINVKNDSNNSNGGHFHIVEERDQVITVSAADMKTNDELQFIEKLQTTKDPSLLSNIVGTCPKCLKKFSNITMFTEHTRRNHCVSKRKCPACPLTFIDTPSLQKHLNMHRDNLFFCSRNCGENFKNLPLCEQHERRVHKLQNPPKIRYKHFCSYCREGFKTELQLHVHWLQQSMGCGKLMQEVVALLFYTASIESNNNNSSSENKNEDNTLGAIKRPIPSTLPVTKLRLKSNLPPLHASKRPIEPVANDMDINQKRSKIMDNIKEKISMPEQMLFNVNTDIQIKEEPVDEEDVINTTPLVPEVIIKTEEENQKLIEPKEEMETPTSDKPIEMKSLLINDNKELNPELQGKIIPMILQKNTGKQMKIQPPPLQMIANCNNNSIVTNNNVKIFPSNKLEKSNNSNIVSNIIPVHNISNQGNTTIV